MPVVESHEILHQASQDGHLLLRVIVEDLFGQLRVLDIAVNAILLMEEALLRRRQFAALDSIVVRRKSPIELNIVAMDGMIRIVLSTISMISSGTNWLLSITESKSLAALHSRPAEGSVRLTGLQ